MEESFFDRENKSGQAMIEFVLTLCFLMVFIFFFLQLSMVFAFGNYVHYATFMSARAYQSAGPDEKDQKNRAQSVLIKMVKRGVGQPNRDKWPLLGQGFGGPGDISGAYIGAYKGETPAFRFDRYEPAKTWLEGVRYNFRARMFLLPFQKTDDENAALLELTSESWLMRDPTFKECIEDLEGRLGVTVGEGVWIDNGC